VIVCKRPALNPAVTGGAGGLTVEPRDALPSGPAAPKALRTLPAARPLQPAPRIVLPQPPPLKPAN